MEQASDEALAILDGDTDGSGGWRGRRQVVWLCEALASFAEFFWACERILFRLAQVETEPSIGNNSTVIWRSLFLPIFSFTEVPFSPRANHLLRRLAGADINTLPLVFSAVVEALKGPEGGRFAPPEVVGGRIVPEPWNPATYGELYRLQQDFGWRALETLGRLPAALVSRGRRAVVANMSVFAFHHLLGELRNLLADSDEETKQGIRLQLRNLINLRERKRKTQPAGAPDSVMEELRRWEAELRPSTLIEQVQDLTALNYWEAMNSFRNPNEPQLPSPYGQLAQAVLGQPEVMQRLVDWFNSDNARSALNFGISLGEIDRDDLAAPIVASWLAEGQCLSLVIGYLRGITSRQGTLPSDWGKRIDQMSQHDARHAAHLTLEADFSRMGFHRVMQLMNLDALPINYVNGFASPNWESVLGVDEKVVILQLLLRLQKRNQQHALGVALSLGAIWSHYGKEPLPAQLAEPLVLALRASLAVRVDPNAWSSLLESVASTHPEDAADVATDALTCCDSLRVVLDDVALKVLLDLAGRHPRLVMYAVGRRILDPDRRPFFGILSFQGLFEAIGLPEVHRWVTEHGAEQVLYIARHLESPRLQDGVPFIPPVTMWVMAQFGTDNRIFREFCVGRHALEVRYGHARDRRAELARAMTPFIQHELPWVRRWAEYELKENEHEAEIDDQLDDRQERM